MVHRAAILNKLTSSLHVAAISLSIQCLLNSPILLSPLFSSLTLTFTDCSDWIVRHVVGGSTQVQYIILKNINEINGGVGGAVKEDGVFELADVKDRKFSAACMKRWDRVAISMMLRPWNIS